MPRFYRDWSHGAGDGGGGGRVISDCHFALQLNHFIPVLLSYSVAVLLK
jgi:hypothetical protein